MNFYIVGGLVLVLLLFSMGIFANKVQEGFQAKKQQWRAEEKVEVQPTTKQPTATTASAGAEGATKTKIEEVMETATPSLATASIATTPSAYETPSAYATPSVYSTLLD